MKATSSSSSHLVNDNSRYSIRIPSFRRQHDYILYQALVFDSAFSFRYSFYFRFKTLKHLHEQLEKRLSSSLLPDFPKTKSLFFWNRTNRSLPLIHERAREL